MECVADWQHGRVATTEDERDLALVLRITVSRCLSCQGLLSINAGFDPNITSYVEKDSSVPVGLREGAEYNLSIWARTCCI